MTATNALSPSTLYRGVYGLRDHSEPINAQNAYKAIASVFACLTAYATNAPQVTGEVQRLDGEPWPDHPVQYLLKNPNDDMGERVLSLYNTIYKPLGGATQLQLLRNTEWPGRPVIGWRPYTTYEMAPVPLIDKPVGRNSWVDHYWHIPALGTPERVEREDVVTLRFPSIDPNIAQMNLSPIAAAFVDINSDKAITTLPAELLNNSAFISAFFALGNGTEEMPDEIFENIKSDVMAQYTAGNKFKPMVARGSGSFEMIHPDFRKMDLGTLGNRPELRICSALRVPVRYIGFNAGVDASTSDNYIASWISFVKDSVLGQALLDYDALTNALVRESWANHPTVAFGTDRRATSLFKIVPNTSEVQALKTEQLLIHTDAGNAYTNGGLTKNEYRALLGKPPVTDGTGDDFVSAKADAQAALPKGKSVSVTDEPNSTKV